MDTDRSLRQRLRATVLEASSPAGKAYNAVIFGAMPSPPASSRCRGCGITSSVGWS